jgi:hypothetical protein
VISFDATRQVQFIFFFSELFSSKNILFRLYSLCDRVIFCAKTKDGGSMSRYANDVSHYISGLEVGFEKAVDALRAIDVDSVNVKYIRMMVCSVLTTVPPEVIDNMSKGVREWIKEIQNGGV